MSWSSISAASAKRRRMRLTTCGGKGVPCAVFAGRGKDYRVLATEAFLIDQEDKAASQREQQRADRLRTRIREIGDEYNTYLVQQKKPGYQFKGCYLLQQR